MIVAFVASLLLVAPSEVPPPDEYGAELSEAANGQDEAAEAAADAVKQAADRVEQAAETAEAATEEAQEADEGMVCSRRHETDPFGRQRSRRVCRPR